MTPERVVLFRFSGKQANMTKGIADQKDGRKKEVNDIWMRCKNAPAVKYNAFESDTMPRSSASAV